MTELEILFEYCKTVCGVESLLCVDSPINCANKKMIEFRKNNTKPLDSVNEV